MTRLITAVCVPSIGSWLFLLAAQQLVAQHAAAQTAVDVPGEAIRIADLGLEDEIPSAIDLVGPESGSAGKHRAELAHRLQCWIDGLETCTFADRNDDRIRDIRCFLVQGPLNRDATVRIHFPDQSRIELRLTRAAGLDPHDLDQPFYQVAVLPDSVQAPGLAVIPSSSGQFAGFVHEGAPAIRAALQRLKQRLDASVPPDRTTAAADTLKGRPAIIKGQFP